MIQQLFLFTEPRDTLLAQALEILRADPWWDNPLHRQTDGGGLWHILPCQGIEVEVEQCREWVRREHPERLEPRPGIVLSGHQAQMARWHRKESLRRTREKPPDLFAKVDVRSKLNQQLLKELEEEERDTGL